MEEFLPFRCTPRRSRAVAAAVAMMLLVASAPPAAAADDPTKQRREVQKKRAQIAAQIDVLKSSNDQLERALDDLESDVRSQDAQLAAARQAAEVAVRRVEAARQAEERTATELAQLRLELRDIAVDAYVRGPTRGLVVAMDATSIADVARRQQLFDVAVGRGTQLADQLRATHEDLGIRRAETEEAQRQAAAERKEEEAKLGELKKAQDAKERVADSVERKLEAALAEADSLAALDAQLAAEIARRQRELARRLASRAGRGGALPAVGSIAVRSVRGIVVATSLADNLEALLAAAEADGIVLSGGGYRDSSAQVALRRAHCGGSEYDIYQRPASQCSPPTARPGFSMHERGLAVDFTEGGGILTRSSPGYRWLKANAARFGLYNLPSEPWHWSTNGQ